MILTSIRQSAALKDPGHGFTCGPELDVEVGPGDPKYKNNNNERAEAIGGVMELKSSNDGHHENEETPECDKHSC